jgi:(2Fe-2S) ferredoxin
VLGRNELFDGKKGRQKPTITAKKWYDEYKPDIVIAYTSYGLDKQYLSSVPCMKVILESDFYKKVRDNDLDWYSKNGIDLIVKRGVHDKKYDCGGIPMVWLPFSVDEKEFSPIALNKKKKIVGFAGSCNSQIYSQRRDAIERLQAAGLIDKRGRRIKKYPEFVRSVLSFLTSAEVGTPHGKVFEIMASKTVLLSPDFRGREELFGRDECFAEYKKDCSNVVAVAQKIMRDEQYAKAVANRAYRIITEHHTHEKRIEELRSHLDNILAGKSIERPWGY